MLYYGVSQFLCPNGSIGGGGDSNQTLPGACTDSQLFTWCVHDCSMSAPHSLCVSISLFI